MSSSPNGQHGGHDDPIRRLRYDDLSAIMEQTAARGARRGGTRTRAPAMEWLGRSYSGRRFVVLGVIAVLVVWGLLYVVFREWRARYRVRAAYGAGQVAPAIDAFAGIAPPDVEPTRWRDAVARTHAMLVTITASNLLGLDQMRDLRADLDRAVDRAKAHPESAVAELAAIWDDMSERGEFLLKDTRSLTGDRHPRPEILPSYGADRVAPALDPLGEMTPPGVDAARWRDAVARTRALLLEVTSSRLISTTRMKGLRTELDRAVARIRAHPDSAVKDLAGVWDSLDRWDRSLFPDARSAAGGDSRHTRPEIFGPNH
jgi:hypothetical protein